MAEDNKKNISKNEGLFNKYLDKMSSLLSTSKEAKQTYDQLSKGKNSYMKINRVQSSAFDNSWLDIIEGVIVDLGDIIALPRTNTKIVTDVIPVELAHKINAESVRHLASHTQFIKDVDEQGNVIPNKILNIGHDDDFKIYENRFIATFVKKLVLFVEKRYEFITQYADLYDEEILYYKNESEVNGANVEIETKVKVKSLKDNKNGVKSNNYLDRIKQIREYVLYFYNTKFIKMFRNDRDVRNPILQTNIIRKNLKYHHCYEVYKFIEKYDSLGVNYKVDERYEDFTSDQINDINTTLLVNFLAIQSKSAVESLKSNSKTYKPKILTSLDDEQFIYGPLLSGPISFVRTDEEYRQYHANKLKNNLPTHPTKKEREYYLNDFSEKKEFKEDLFETDKLLKRCKKNADEYEKEVQRLIAEREIENARIERERLAKVAAEEDEKLNKVREEVIRTALKDFPHNPFDNKDYRKYFGIIQDIEDFPSYDDLFDYTSVKSKEAEFGVGITSYFDDTFIFGEENYNEKSRTGEEFEGLIEGKITKDKDYDYLFKNSKNLAEDVIEDEDELLEKGPSELDKEIEKRLSKINSYGLNDSEISDLLDLNSSEEDYFEDGGHFDRKQLEEMALKKAQQEAEEQARIQAKKDAAEAKRQKELTDARNEAKEKAIAETKEIARNEAREEFEEHKKQLEEEQSRMRNELIALQDANKKQAEEIEKLREEARVAEERRKAAEERATEEIARADEAVIKADEATRKAEEVSQALAISQANEQEAKERQKVLEDQAEIEREFRERAIQTARDEAKEEAKEEAYRQAQVAIFEQTRAAEEEQARINKELEEVKEAHRKQAEELEKAQEDARIAEESRRLAEETAAEESRKAQEAQEQAAEAARDARHANEAAMAAKAAEQIAREKQRTAEEQIVSERENAEKELEAARNEASKAQEEAKRQAEEARREANKEAIEAKREAEAAIVKARKAEKEAADALAKQEAAEEARKQAEQQSASDKAEAEAAVKEARKQAEVANAEAKKAAQAAAIALAAEQVAREKQKAAEQRAASERANAANAVEEARKEAELARKQAEAARREAQQAEKEAQKQAEIAQRQANKESAEAKREAELAKTKARKAAEAAAAALAAEQLAKEKHKAAEKRVAEQKALSDSELKEANKQTEEVKKEAQTAKEQSKKAHVLGAGLNLAEGERELSDEEIENLADDGDENETNTPKGGAQGENRQFNKRDDANMSSFEKLQDSYYKRMNINPYDYDDGSGVRYIVRQFHGYYVSETQTTRKKYEAFVFKSNRAIKRFKKTHYGRVIKLKDNQ